MSLSAFGRGVLLALLTVGFGSHWTLAGDALKSEALPDYQQVELFEALDRGDLIATVHVSNATELHLAIENKTDRKLAVNMPAAFAAVPIHAQFQPGGLRQGGFQPGGFNQGNNSQNQGVGGPGGGRNQGNQGNQGNIFNNPGIFNVPPGKILKAKQPCVCLEHGKADPNPRLDYEIRPLEQVIADPVVEKLLQLLVLGPRHQTVQLAIWHRANGIAWEELAATKIDRLGRPDQRRYSSKQIEAAQKLLDKVIEYEKKAEKASPGELSQTSPSP